MKTNTQLKEEIINFWQQGKSLFWIQGRLNVLIEINCSLAELHEKIVNGEFTVKIY